NIIFIQETLIIYVRKQYSITYRNNASNLNFGGGFRWQSENPWCIIQVKSKHFKIIRQVVYTNRCNLRSPDLSDENMILKRTYYLTRYP
ncbi:Uncharacterized protein FWK35_00032947, partial [Aphis craccivora]